MGKEEIQIIRKCLRNNREAQKILYIKYKTKWSIVCLRYSSDKSQAEDMLQDSLVSIFSNLHQFNINIGSFSQWAHRIVVNSCLQYLRKWKHLNFNETIENHRNFKDNIESIYDKIGAKELTQLIQKLPNGYKVVFNMYVVEGYKHREIAEILNITIGTSKSQLAKSKLLLRKRLELLLQT